VGSPGQAVASRPDHIVLSSALFAMAGGVDIQPAKHISDHCPTSMCFHVAGDARNVDWRLCPVHVCPEVLTLSSGGL